MKLQSILGVMWGPLVKWFVETWKVLASTSHGQSFVAGKDCSLNVCTSPHCQGKPEFELSCEPFTFLKSIFFLTLAGIQNNLEILKKKKYSRLTMRKTSHKSQVRDILQIRTSIPQDGQDDQDQGKSELLQWPREPKETGQLNGTW